MYQETNVEVKNQISENKEVDDMRFIRRYESKKVWAVKFNKMKHPATFSDIMYEGKENSLIAAKAFRNKKEHKNPVSLYNMAKHITIYKNNKTGESGIQRVSYKGKNEIYYYWKAYFSVKKETIQKTFSVKEFGEEAARNMAISWKNEFLKNYALQNNTIPYCEKESIEKVNKLFTYAVKTNNTSGFTGVSLKRYKNGEPHTWAAYWPENNKRKSMPFSISKYGYEKAFEMAKEYRLKKLKELGRFVCPAEV